MNQASVRNKACKLILEKENKEWLQNNYYYQERAWVKIIKSVVKISDTPDSSRPPQAPHTHCHCKDTYFIV